MDKMNLSIGVLPIDIAQHNQTLEIYKQYLFPPLRNALCFSDTYNKSIVIPQIDEKINFLRSIGFKFDYICEIKYNVCASGDTWYFKYEGNIDDEIIAIASTILKNDITLKYLSINNIVYKDEFMIDIINMINGKQVMYNPTSFRQNDVNIKNTVYEILQSTIITKKLYLIGGEMVFYATLLNPEIDTCIMYTDFQSIYDDATHNFPDNKQISLINYDKDTLQKSTPDYFMIANTSKHGLGNNLCNEILKLELNDIVIISCNVRSFMRDYKKLSSKYNIVKIYDINTNYNVCMYFLRIK